METVFLLILILTMITALASGFPVAFALPGSAIVSILLAALFGYFIEGDVSAFFAQDGPIEWLTAGVTNFRGVYWEVEGDTLIAIPLFIFMGIMLQRSKIAEDLLVTMGQLFGPIPGGLGISVIFVGALLAATTGIVGATVIAMGLISLPAMLNNKYDKSLASGIVCSSGTLGQIIPPSIVLIILADQLGSATDVANTMRAAEYKKFTGQFNMPGEFTVSSTSAGDMFLGALLPGLVLVGLYMLYIFVYARFKPNAAPPVPYEGKFDSAFWFKVLLIIIPPLALIFAVLGSILLGIATVNQAGSIGAIGATIMAGYRLAKGQKNAFTPIIISFISLVIIFLLANYFDLNIKNIQNKQNFIAILVTAFFVFTFFISIGWSFWRTYKIDNVLKNVVTETCITTSMVFIILLGAAMLTAAFRAFGGEELVRNFLQDLPGGFWTQFIVVMAVIFLLGFFLDFIEIAVVVVPIIAPILLAETSANVTAVWLGVMIGVNMQTSFLTPPFGFSLFYLKGVAPKSVTTIDIWRGAVAFIVLQLIGLGIVGFYPTLVNYLPNRTYLTSKVAPPPMNPRLQYCLQEYKFSSYNTNERELRNDIANIQSLNFNYLPENKTEIINSHFEKALLTFDLAKKVQETENEYNLFTKDYRPLHFKVRKIQKKIFKIDNKIKKLKSDIRHLDKDDILNEKEKIEKEIKNLESEKRELKENIPQNWSEQNKKFKNVHKNKYIATKKYRKNADESYEELNQIKMFIKEAIQLKAVSKNLNLLSHEIESENINGIEKKVDELLEKLTEITGVDEIIEKLDEINSMIQEEEVDDEKMANLNDEIVAIFNEEINWRQKASQSLLKRLNEYDDKIKNTIGLRLQERLTKKQAKFVSKCRSIHRDISLNF